MLQTEQVYGGEIYCNIIEELCNPRDSSVASH